MTHSIRKNHWGWYWHIKKKHTPRTLCSALTSIDSFKILSDKNIYGFTVQPFGLNALIKADHVLITYGKHKASSYSIPIEKLTCHFGGFRYFFRCPLCQKRMMSNKKTA